MFDNSGEVFFDALVQAAARHLDRDHPCLEALRATARANTPDTTIAAQQALAALDPAIMNAVMAEAHRLLRENPGHILGAWKSDGARH